MSGERRDDETTPQEEGSAPPVRNPFDESQPDQPPEKPVLISSKRSAALLGVAAGLIALLLVVGVCVMGSIAFS